MSFKATPVSVEEFEGNKIGGYVVGHPTSAPTSGARSSRNISRVVHVIEPDDDYTPSRQDRNVSSRDQSTSYLIERRARKKNDPPKESTKPTVEQYGRRERSSSKKCSTPCVVSQKTPRRRGKKNGPSALEMLPVISPIAIHDARDGNLRRSTRTRLAPLEYWKNERPMYGPHNESGLLGEAMGNMPVVVGVQRESGITYFTHNNGLATQQGDASRERFLNVVDDNDWSSDIEIVSLMAKSATNIFSLMKRFNEVNRSHAKRINTLEDANENLRTQLKCPVCYELQEGNMYLIVECGHRICGECSLCLGNKCHTCRTSLDKERGWLKKIY